VLLQSVIFSAWPIHTLTLWTLYRCHNFTVDTVGGGAPVVPQLPTVQLWQIFSYVCYVMVIVWILFSRLSMLPSFQPSSGNSQTAFVHHITLTDRFLIRISSSCEIFMTLIFTDIQVFPGKAAALNRQGGKIKNLKKLSTAHSLNNKCAKNCCKCTILVQLIIEDMVIRFGTLCRLWYCC